MIHTILTHPGGAHKDDFLAVCVLAGQHGARIVRRVPTQADLDDPGVAVVDVGGEHDPARNNFDHHHFPREHSPTCALSLVLDALGLYDEARRVFDWLEPAEWFDSRGPNKTAAWLGVPRKAIDQLHSPLDQVLLRRFSQQTEVAADDTLHACMRMIGEGLLEQLVAAQERLAFARQHVQRWSIPVGDETIEAVFLPRTHPMADEPSTAVGDWIRAEGLDSTIAAIVYPDRRGGGYGIGRYEDHPKLDFVRVQDQPDVHFAHKSGFMCKTSATSPDRLRALIQGAWGQAATP